MRRERTDQDTYAWTALPVSTPAFLLPQPPLALHRTRLDFPQPGSVSEKVNTLLE